MSLSGPIAELVAVRKSYSIQAQQVTALDGVDLELPAGRVAALIGKSGAGKSTLLHLLGTLDTPSSGEVKLMGQSLGGASDRQTSTLRNRTIGFVFQMNNLLPEFSAEENVMMPGLIAGFGRRTVRERARKVLGQVQLEHRCHHRPGELSGGEQQRVAIARALLMEPPLLLADEPTGNLDKKTSKAIEELLLELCSLHGMTMVLVTHDLELARRLPYQIVMEDGKIIDQGST